MIGVIFTFGTEYVQVTIDGNNVYFKSSAYGNNSYPIDSLTLDKAGVCREFPDLEEDEEWRFKAIERFKNHIASLPYEKKKAEYIMNDLSKFGYTPIAFQKSGHRIQKPTNVEGTWII